MLRIDPLFQTEYYITFPKIICLVLSCLRKRFRGSDRTSGQRIRLLSNSETLPKITVLTLMRTPQVRKTFTAWWKPLNTLLINARRKASWAISTITTVWISTTSNAKYKTSWLWLIEATTPTPLSRSRPLYLKGNLGKWPHLVTHWQKQLCRKKRIL